MKELTILFATSDEEEHLTFRKIVVQRGLPYRVLFPDTVSRVDTLIKNEKVDIIVTDLLFQNGGFADWLFLWPMPFVLLGNYEDEKRIDEVIKDDACAFLIREPEGKHLSVLPIMIRKVLNHRESIDRQNLHIQISERRYLDLVQALPDIVFTLDAEGYFTFVNDSVRNLGYEPVELIGKHFSFILDPQEVPRVSRREVLKDFLGKATGRQGSPKLFDERRTGERKTSDLEIKLKPKELPEGDKRKIGSVISYGEVSSVGFSSLGYEAGNPGSAGIIRDITARKETERMIRESLKEKEILLKEIHHRVKNNLQIISSLLSLQGNYIKDPEDLRLFIDSQMQVGSMALVHEQLYQSERLSRINMKEYLQALCDKLYDVYRISPHHVALSSEVEDLFFDVDAATPIALLVNELISNSIKYAFPGDAGGTIRLELRRENSSCRLVVRDDGIGLPEEFDLANSQTLGHQLIASLVDQINGSISRLEGPGTAFVILFPYDETVLKESED